MIERAEYHYLSSNKYIIENRQNPALNGIQIKGALDYLNIIQNSDPYRDGYVTLALIKPHADMNCCGYTDEQTYQNIRNIIQPLIIFEFSHVVPQNFWEIWYDGLPKEKMSQVLASNPIIFKNKWEEYINNLSTGTNTFLILLFDNPNAISTWRDMIGPTDPIKAKQFAPDSIRAQFARDFENNLVHGSDSPAALDREIKLTQELLVNLKSPIHKSDL
jgi:nucleoside diphosphate kinase